MIQIKMIKIIMNPYIHYSPQKKTLKLMPLLILILKIVKKVVIKVVQAK